MILKLKGIFSYIESSNKTHKLHFVFLDDDKSLDKLQSLINNCSLPYTNDQFTVSLNFNPIPSDIASLVGKRVDVWVTLVNYSFVSKANHNKGQKISGVRLLLENISAI